MNQIHRLKVCATLSAFLLFQVQPIIARFVLPWFGGSPAVWTTCVLFFQTVLLLGYLYAHTLRRTWVHIGLLAASLGLLPVIPRAEFWKPATSNNPTGRILLLLAATAGGPYFLLSTTAPLVQRWFHGSKPEGSPWRLYALSNLGSFVALISYPFLVEPFVRLRTEAWLWSGAYVLFAGLYAFTAWRSGGEGSWQDWRLRSHPWDILYWVGLAASAAIILLAVTNEISQEIAVNPFLWVAPMSLYLLTFVLTFDSPRWYRRALYAPLAGILAAVSCGVLAAAVALSLWWQIGVYLATLFATCMVCHGELVRAKPEPGHLTVFYLAVAAGGVLGGVFAALIAPQIFTEYTEFPAGLAGACLLGLAGWLRGGGMSLWTSRNFAVRIPIMALLLGGLTAVAAAVIAAPSPGTEARRNFYGILRVSETRDENGPLRKLNHGTITHGFQYLDADKRRRPTAYYGPRSGAGIALAALDQPGRRIAVAGLGTGTLAAWGRPGDVIRFYEINPDVVEIAKTRFTFLADSRAEVQIALGDARVQLERELAQGQAHDYDLIALDAFSSDAIPLHLLTAESADLYRARLKPGGLLLLHISNRRLNLEPVARGLAQHLGWPAAYFVSPKDDRTGESEAHWVLITADLRLLRQASAASKAAGWTAGGPQPLLWTDDFASLWHVLK